MTSEFRAPARQVPTLTEVVRFSKPASEPIQPIVRVETVVEQVMLRLQPSLESRLLQGLDTVLLEQLEALELRLREKIQKVLLEAVQEEVKRQLDTQAKRF
ncbi:MAG: hypothetical protein WBI20_07815 [Burkholderiaceae bacterium]